MLHELLDENYNIDELKDLTFQLGLDWENLAGETRIRKASELTTKIERSHRSRELLTAVDLGGRGLDLSPYLYLVVLDFYSTRDKMIALLTSFGIEPRNFGGREKHPWGSAVWRKQKAKALQKKLEEDGRIGELLAAIQAESQARFQEDVDFTFYPLSLDIYENEVDAAELEEADVYNNFDIDLKIVGDIFLVEASGTEGEAWKDHNSAVLRDPELHELLAFVSGLVSGPEDIKQLGERFRKVLFPDDIWTKYIECLKDSEGTAGLRLRLRFREDEAELIRLPWEYCRDNQDYFAVNTPVIRYLKTEKAPRPITVPEQVRLLIATASPEGYDSLSVLEEAKSIEDALNDLTGAGNPRMVVEVKHGVTIGDLDDAITSRTGFRPHILHFIGHGELENGQGRLILDDGNGQAKPLDGETLLRPLRNYKSRVKVVILNACLTAAFGSDQAIAGLAPRLVWGGVPAVIAMQYAIPDTMAAKFSSKLYKELAAGAPLDEAMTDARRSVSLDDVFWGIPALYMRSPDGIIWTKPEE